MNFTCTYTPSEALLRQYHYRVKNSGIRTWLWLGVALLVGSAIIYIHTRQPLDLVFFLLGLYMGIREVTAPGRNAKKEWAALQKKYGGEPPQITVTIDEEKAVLVKDDTETVVLLEDVLGLYFCKDCTVLHGYHQDILITETGEECRKFLNEHCKNAPAYKR